MVLNVTHMSPVEQTTLTMRHVRNTRCVDSGYDASGGLLCCVWISYHVTGRTQVICDHPPNDQFTSLQPETTPPKASVPSKNGESCSCHGSEWVQDRAEGGGGVIGRSLTLLKQLVGE